MRAPRLLRTRAGLSIALAAPVLAAAVTAAALPSAPVEETSERLVSSGSSPVEAPEAVAPYLPETGYALPEEGPYDLPASQGGFSGFAFAEGRERPELPWINEDEYPAYRFIPSRPRFVPPAAPSSPAPSALDRTPTPKQKEAPKAKPDTPKYEVPDSLKPKKPSAPAPKPVTPKPDTSKPDTPSVPAPKPDAPEYEVPDSLKPKPPVVTPEVPETPEVPVVPEEPVVETPAPQIPEGPETELPAEPETPPSDEESTPVEEPVEMPEEVPAVEVPTEESPAEEDLGVLEEMLTSPLVDGVVETVSTTFVSPVSLLATTLISLTEGDTPAPESTCASEDEMVLRLPECFPDLTVRV